MFRALPTRVDLVLSNAEFRFMLGSFWGSDLTIIDQAKKMTPGRQPLVCVAHQSQQMVTTYNAASIFLRVGDMISSTTQ